MVEVQINKKKFTMPERWDECTLEQISKLSPLTQWKVDEITQSEHEYAVCVLMGCSDKFWQRLELELPQWYKLKEVANFAFAEKIVEQPFPSFVHLGTEYLVFQEGFADTDAVDLAWANMQYLAFANPDAPNVVALDELIATLCRPRRKDLLTFRESKEWDGDEREVYNGQRVKARAKELKTLPFGLKVAILQYFEAQNSLFLENYSQMLGDDGREPRYGNGMGWVTMLMSVAEKGTFGNFESVCYQNVHLIWAKCLDDTLDVKEQEKQLEAQRFKNS
ncbi:hypothetical protein VB264_05170 [Arcicella aquatica]|uniref:Uncharacterized protein n=1 Tax=Arcicella aquatica TaxID=217141 RepID=A0ABU5QJD4_9BACT|nr:hypothetical protein [Arcicella aquatica]MEA5257167.1 hypothetical protein [Arcicella aquatica]